MEKQIIITKDSVEGSWVYRNAPTAVRPYLKLARMDRPVGTWLLLWPCWWSIWLALPQTQAISLWQVALLMGMFGLGALAMRGAGCTYNDIVDKDFDAQVDRTKSRPIPAGEISIKQAWVFLFGQCLIGLSVLLLLPVAAIWLGVLSLALVAIYPFMKRITYWPQAWLGLTFNWGALMGWAAISGSWPGGAALLLYAGGLFWTLGYDTIYAHQDAEDDALIGVKSTALAFGEKSPIYIAVFYSLFFICLVGAGVLANLSDFYYIGLSFAAIHLFGQVKRLDIADGQQCLNLFRSNIGFGWLVFAALIAGQLL